MLISLCLFGMLFFFLVIGIPVSFALLAAGMAGILLGANLTAVSGVVSSAPYENVAGYTLSTLPMFILMGEFLAAGRYIGDLFNFFNRCVGHIRGGLAYGVVACGVMVAAVTGSSTAASAMLAKTAYPEMRRYGYARSFSTGALAVVGTLAVMIPPSIALIFYGIFTETSVGDLLLAGFLPGLVTAAGYFLTIAWRIRSNPQLAPDVSPRSSWRERYRAGRSIWPVMLLMVLVIAALYGGVFTPTEIGAVGAVIALILGLVMRRLRWRSVLTALEGATRASAMILFIIAGAAVFGIALTLTGVTQSLLGFVMEHEPNRWVVLALIVMILLVLGFVLDQLAILALTLPIAFPMISALGFDPVWFGVIVVKTIEIGLITPPLGLNVFVVASTTGEKPNTVFSGIWWFVIAEVVVLTILIVWPDITLLVPTLARQ